MKKELIKAFQNDKFGNVRVVLVGVNQEPYFVGKDVAGCLGYANTRDALKKHVFDEDKDAVAVADSIGRMQNTTVINESGLYALVFGSELPSAKEFKRWVTSEVLPSIRKHGAYMTDNALEKALTEPDFLIQLATKLKEEKEANNALKLENTKQTQVIAELKPKADYTDKILANKSLMTVSQISKDYGMSAQEMNNKLHELGVQYKQGSQWLLYAKYHSNGYTHSNPNTITHKNGYEEIIMNTKWTQKGRLFIYEVLKKENILPMIERRVIHGQG